MTNQIILDMKKGEWFAIVLKQWKGGEEEVALLNFVIIKIKDEGLTSKLNQMHPK